MGVWEHKRGTGEASGIYASRHNPDNANQRRQMDPDLQQHQSPPPPAGKDEEESPARGHDTFMSDTESVRDEKGEQSSHSSGETMVLKTPDSESVADLADEADMEICTSDSGVAIVNEEMQSTQPAPTENLHKTCIAEKAALRKEVDAANAMIQELLQANEEIVVDFQNQRLGDKAEFEKLLEKANAGKWVAEFNLRLFKENGAKERKEWQETLQEAFAHGDALRMENKSLKEEIDRLKGLTGDAARLSLAVKSLEKDYEAVKEERDSLRTELCKRIEEVESQNAQAHATEPCCDNDLYCMH